MSRRLALARRLGAILSLVLAFPLSADTLHIIQLRHRPAQEIEPALRPLLQPDEALSVTGYQLLLRASDKRRAEIERIVASLDVALRQLTVTVRQGIARDESRQQDSVSGDVAVGSRGKIRIGETGNSRDEETIRYRGERRESHNDNVQTQTLRVQDGQRAFIRVGQSVPIVERIVLLTGRGTVLAARGLTYQDFTTGFDIIPRTRGETIQIEITPRLTGPRQADGVFQFQELKTTVTVRRGEWVDLGAIVGNASDVHRAILSRGAAQTTERRHLSLKIE